MTGSSGMKPIVERDKQSSLKREFKRPKTAQPQTFKSKNKKKSGKNMINQLSDYLQRTDSI